jgi:hypothetical protein
VFRNFVAGAMGKKGGGCERKRQRKKKTPRQEQWRGVETLGAQ